MGTRYFSGFEKKDSRIHWELADLDTARKLASAINKYNKTNVTRIIVFAPGVVLIILFVFMMVVSKNDRNLQQVDPIRIVFYVVYGLAIASFFVFFLHKYRKFKPYLYPEKQSNIWIFRATCADIREMGPHDHDDMRHYYANFNKGGDCISIRIRVDEYRSNPTGKEYIFYKFNKHFGTRWAAISSEKIEENDC